MLQNEYSLKKIGFDTAESASSKLCSKLNPKAFYPTKQRRWTPLSTADRGMLVGVGNIAQPPEDARAASPVAAGDVFLAVRLL